jgi:predicted nucleotidyltransferase
MRTVNSIKLTESERASILEAAEFLKSDLPVAHVILFGSKARSAGGPDSDIDLLVLTHCPVGNDLRDAISDRLADINLRNDVLMTSVVISEQEWIDGLVRYTLLHSEVEKDGCEV